MSLLAALKLTAPKAAGAAKAAPGGPPNPGGATAAGSKKGALSKSKVSNDDAADGDIVIAAQKPLGQIAFERHRATIWAMTDTTGAVSNGGSRQQAHLAQLNKLGAMVLSAVKEMNDMESTWRQKVDIVRRATTQSAVDIKKVVAELPDMRARRKKDDTFFKDINGWLEGMHKAEATVGQIRSAEHGLEQAAAILKKDELWKSVNDKTEEIKKDETAVKAKEAEIAEAKRIAGAVFDIAEMVIKQDWSGLASKAISFVKGAAKDAFIDGLVDDRYGKELADLQVKLKTAEGDLKKLTNAAYVTAIEGSRAGVSKALTDLDNAKNEFKNAIEGLEALQQAASDMLARSPATAAVGAMLEQRTRQLNSIDVARAACQHYNRVCDTTRKRLGLVSNEYGTFGSWIGNAESADAAFDRAQGYAKILELSAASNAVECGRWDDWLGGVVGSSTTSIAWLADKSAKGPMVHFEEALKTAKDSLVNATAPR